MTMQPPVHVPMPTPVFEEYEPAGDCGCPGCAERRRSLARARAIPLRDGGHPAARGARRALVLATAAGAVLGGGTASTALAAHAPAPDTATGTAPSREARAAGGADTADTADTRSGTAADARPGSAGDARTRDAAGTRPGAAEAARAGIAGSAGGAGTRDAADTRPGTDEATHTRPTADPRPADTGKPRRPDAGSDARRTDTAHGRPGDVPSARPGRDTPDNPGSRPGRDTRDDTGARPGGHTRDDTGARPGRDTRDDTAVRPGGDTPDHPGARPGRDTRDDTAVRPGREARDDPGARPGQDDRDDPGARPDRDDRDDPAGTPQGDRSPLHGRPGPVKPGGAPGAPSSVRRIDRATIINRAKLWLDAKVPYSMSSYWTDGYRQDCSGYVSMAWNLGSNEWTGSLDKFATRITKDELLPGDMLLFHNPADPTNGSHVVLFGGWVDETRTHYMAYEQTRPATRKAATPYGYWNNSSKYVPYRFTGVTGGLTAPAPEPAAPDPGADPKPAAPSKEYPGAAMFGPGADNPHVAELGRMLIERGGRRFYPKGPSTKWSDADRLATQAFQSAQGWTGADADGVPGPYTWQLLVEGGGKDIRPTIDPAPGPTASQAGRPGAPARPGTPAARPAPAAPPAPGAPGAPARPSTGAARPGTVATPAYPGASVFRPGSTHPSIAALGRRLVEKGFGKHYTTGPGPGWSEADRRSVEAFQRAQGWRGAAADGYPGPETWRRLFA
ncbi:peptidoglycan-binding protein [Streptomyces toxytricini]